MSCPICEFSANLVRNLRAKRGQCCKLNAMMNRADVQALAKLVGDRLGLDIERRVQFNVGDLLHSLGITNITDYLAQLRLEALTSPVWQQLVEHLTIGETYFFRNRVQFDLLRSHIIPQIIERNAVRRQITVWSVGASTGEEAYSLAILLLEHLPKDEIWHPVIVATDISTRAITQARQGIYRDWSFRHAADDQPIKSKYFRKLEHGFQADSNLRQMVTFRQANLLDVEMGLRFDLILCRNVLLYFREDSKRQAEDRLHQALTPEGWLLLGNAEAMHYHRERWCTHVFPSAIAYQHVDASPASGLHQHRDNDTGSRQITAFVQRRQYAPDVEQLYQEAVNAFHTKQHNRASDLLAGLLNDNPRDIKAQVLLAAVFANRGAIPEAHVQLDRALDLQPLNGDAHYLKGMLYLEKNEFERAEVSLRAALYSEKGHPLAAFVLGNLLAQRGDLKRAHSLWTQALQAATQADDPDRPLSVLTTRSAENFAALVRNLLDD